MFLEAYALFFILSGYIITSSESHNFPPAFPGSWVEGDDSMSPLDFSFNLITFGGRRVREYYYRGKFLAMVMPLIVMAGAILTFLSVCWPFMGVAILIQFFGVVPGVSMFYSFMLLIASGCSFALAVFSFYWMDIVYPILSAVFASSVPARVSGVSVGNRAAERLRAEFRLFKAEPLFFRGRRWNPETISLAEDDDLAEFWTVMSYWLYAPSVVPAAFTGVSSITMLVLIFNQRIWSAVRYSTRSVWWTMKFLWAAAWLSVTLRPGLLMWLTDFVIGFWRTFFRLVWFYRSNPRREARAAVRLAIAIVVMRTVRLMQIVSLMAFRHKPSGQERLSQKTRLASYWNNTIIDLGRIVDNIALPHFIRGIPTLFDADAINKTNEIMAELGWPTAPPVGSIPNTDPLNFEKFREYFIGGTEIRQGIRQLRLQVSKELEGLKSLAEEPGWKHTKQYATIENELESVSRYFTVDPIDVPDVGVDELWVLIGKIFENSTLTPLQAIIKKWEKKYGLGPFYGDPDSKRWRKLSRRKFIRTIGGMDEFLKLVTRTFEIATSLVPVSPVSVKDESLPPKKWMNDVVRTVVGSPLAHYFSTTVFNFQVNHNFQYWSTNVKIGMPLNGFNLARLFAEHDGYDKHFEGDFTGFDATVHSQVVEMIKKVRKKGFERHRDYAKICYLIDANYANLEKMPLMTTSTGNIYRKSTGLSTGHSSTSMDNSLAVTIYYLAAWKQLTGLSAHEFRHYCKLSNYGDDHILSWYSTAPATWNPHNIIKAMKGFGVILRDENPGANLIDMRFLAKRFRRITSSDVSKLQSMGIPIPYVAVLHDPTRLVGKAYAPSKDHKKDRFYRAKRLTSYLSLTAHQPELYEKIRADIDRILISNAGKKLNPPVPIPTYEDVLKAWYRPDSHIQEEDEDDPSGQIMDYSVKGPFEQLVNLVAVVPDLLNPSIYNMGYVAWFIKQCGVHVHWPTELLRRSNGCITDSHLVATMRKTPYDFLSNSPFVTSAHTAHSDDALITKHWLFLLLRGYLPSTNVADGIAFIDKKIGSANFALNAYVQSIVKTLDIPFADLALVAALDFIPDLPFVGLVNIIRIPSFSSLVSYLIGVAYTEMWALVPANMKQVKPALDSLGDSNPCVVVQAPTGVGKSTALVAYIWKFYGHKYDRMIMVLPRAVLPVSLAPYLRNSFGLPAQVVGDQMAFDSSYRLILTTPQEVLLHPDWLTENNLFFVDECHVAEPAMLAVQKILRHLVKPRVLASATPSEHNKDDGQVIPMTLANVRSVEDLNWRREPLSPEHTFNDVIRHYRNLVVDIVRSQPLSKFLVFVVDLKEAEAMAYSLPLSTTILSSRNKVIDPKASVVIATSVADVGLTIPSVDWVITHNILRKARYKGGRTETYLTKADQSTILQRKGRTGRTNNGVFTLIRYEGEVPWIEEASYPSEKQVGLELLASGIPAQIISQFYPEVIAHFFGSDYTREMDKPIEDFVRFYAMFDSALHKHNYRSFKPDIDEPGSASLYTVQGNTLPSTWVDRGKMPDRDGIAYPTRPATAEAVFKVMVAASKWLASSDESVTKGMKEEDLVAYLRLHTFDLRTFQRYVERNKGWRFNLSARSLEGIDPTGRFGTRSGLTRTQGYFSEEELWQGVDINWDV
ncbi:RNA-dependent RNA polymerase [Sclerotium rolfsii fusarivirus 1]|uniref:RNA-dependent RNA polymerase n=1 Tax=Sclerotium rolfsii fusarivirus 1 TaxID=2490823 RepID=A0AAD0ZYF2_9VIRU|nr:RNA-dependent RNA polymerase [Sclerotium rolfsii fusarivirus 1]AZF86096.1 RNA-dependent RNA polymerase [Sclerotium rolfsii fusarivirus 1]